MKVTTLLTLSMLIQSMLLLPACADMMNDYSQVAQQREPAPSPRQEPAPPAKVELRPLPPEAVRALGLEDAAFVLAVTHTGPVVLYRAPNRREFPQDRPIATDYLTDFFSLGVVRFQAANPHECVGVKADGLLEYDCVPH